MGSLFAAVFYSIIKFVEYDTEWRESKLRAKGPEDGNRGDVQFYAENDAEAQRGRVRHDKTNGEGLNRPESLDLESQMVLAQSSPKIGQAREGALQRKRDAIDIV